MSDGTEEAFGPAVVQELFPQRTAFRADQVGIAFFERIVGITPTFQAGVAVAGGQDAGRHDAGDPLAQDVSRKLAAVFAHALRNICLVFDPDCVILQGDYAAADDVFRQALEENLSGFRYFPSSMPFTLLSDTRTLSEMDAEGAFIALDHLYFGNPDLYRDEPAEG